MTPTQVFVLLIIGPFVLFKAGLIVAAVLAARDEAEDKRERRLVWPRLLGGGHRH
jgi:hypothetical protein